MVKKSSNSSKQTSLFDIRLKNHDHDVLVLKGSPQDAGAALLSGKIALSVKEPFTMKKLSLRLYATLRIISQESPHSIKPQNPRPVRHERKIYEYVWDNMEINKYLNNMYDNTTNTTGPIGLKREGSSTSLKGLNAFRTKSSGNLSSLALTPNESSSTLSSLSRSASSTNLGKSGNHILVSGNYEFPFSAILPGSIPESVEGLPGASVLYKLEATIDRGKFHNSLVAKKHLRVIRTLTTDAVELSETIAVDNTWPKKVEYSLNVPCKAIAIGSGTPISMMMVPLSKGLKLGEIKISLVEYYSHMGYVPPAHNGERIVAAKTIPQPSDDDPDLEMDRWEIEAFLKVPPSLSKCTQDCDILSNIKVRHKIKFAIGLINPDGHVSELRASLPVMLFISPFVSVSAVADSHDVIDDEHQEEDILFGDANRSNTSLNNLEATANANDNQVTSNRSSYSSFSGLVAPPLYEQHIYDRLWLDVSPIDSPITSGSSTPRPINTHNQPGSGTLHELSMSPLDSAQLTENLRLLSLQRQGDSDASSITNGRATFNLDGDANDHFGRRPPLSSSSTQYSLMSPGAISPAMHLSRTASESFINSTPMSTVPSYSHAIKSLEAEEEQLSPAYEPPLPGSNVDITQANRNFEEALSTSAPRAKPPLSRGNSLNLRNLSSNNSSPNSSRSASSSNLSAFFNKSTTTKVQTSSPKPQPPSPAHTSSLSTSPASHAPSFATSVAQPSSSASNRTAAILGVNVPLRSSSSLSLHNLHFLNKKKEKKPAGMQEFS